MKRGWKKTSIAFALSGAAVILFTACGSQITDDVLEEIDPPQFDYIEDEEELDLEVMEEDFGETSSITSDMEASESDDEVVVAEKGGPEAQTNTQELYLMDRNGMVTPQSVEVLLGEDKLMSLVDFLIQEGPITEMLPNGFQAVLPPGTEVLDTNVTNQVATINFNSDFGDYHPSAELSVLQSLTWTLTQLDNIDRVKINMEGEELTAMPQNGTPIGQGYTREHGINLEMNDQADIVSTTPVIVYFLSQTDDQSYYVPVTRRVEQSENKYIDVVNELLEGPSFMSHLLTDFRQEVELIDKPSYEKGVLTLNFNEALLSQLEGTAVSENVLNMLVLSLTEYDEIEKVSIMVNSDPALMVSNGEPLTEPVNRPSSVNIGQF